MGIVAALVVALLALAAPGCGGGGGGGPTSTAAELVTVPDLVGLTPDAAVRRVCAARLAPAAPVVVTGPRVQGATPAQIAARIRVTASSPAAGDRVPAGTPVVLTVRAPANASLLSRAGSCETLSAAPGWTVDLEDVALGPEGVGMGLHPTAAPVAISVDSDLALEACPADAAGRPAEPTRSSWGRRWMACRPLGRNTVELPPTDGRSHVGVVIRPVGGGSATAARIRVRWTCADRHFVFRDPSGRTPAPVPRCAVPNP